MLQKSICSWRDIFHCFGFLCKHSRFISALATSLPSSTSVQLSSASQLSVQTAKEQQKARVALRFLGRQGLPLRGHDDAEGNLQQTLKLTQQDSAELRHSRHSKYTSPDIQNEMSMMTHSILRQIVLRVQTGKFYSVIADETTHSSRKQQLSVCIRSASDDLQIN